MREQENNDFDRICFNCRWCKEDGGEGEDCNTYFICRRDTPWHLTQLSETCSGFRPLPWLTAENSENGFGGEA